MLSVRLGFLRISRVMEYELRVIVEKFAVVQRDTLENYDISFPESILELSLLHTEQVSLLQKIQDAILSEQFFPKS